MSNGYHSYDDVNSYQHRRYGRTHRYRAPVKDYTDGETVSYDSIRVTIPPDSPNFCFVPLAELSICGTPEEAVSNKECNLRFKVKSLFYRPMGAGPITSGVSYTPDTEALIDKLLDDSATVLRNQEDPDNAGFWAPDWMTLGGCLAGGNVESRKEEFYEEELEAAVQEIVTMWNKSTLLVAAGANITFADIGNAVLGFCVEVLPYLPLHEPGTQNPYQLNTGGEAPPMVTNPHFLQPPPSYASAVAAPPSMAEMLSVSMMAQVSRGVEVPEDAYDAVMAQAISTLAEEPEVVTASYYRPFLVTVPEGAIEGAILTVVNPQDGFFLNVTVPPMCPPGTPIMVTLPTVTNADVVAAPYTPGPSSSTASIVEEDAPPSYAELMYSYSPSTAAASDTVARAMH